MLVEGGLAMKVGDLVRCPPLNNRHGYHVFDQDDKLADLERPLGIFVGHEDRPPHGYALVLVTGKKLMFLTRELEVVSASR